MPKPNFDAFVNSNPERVWCIRKAINNLIVLGKKVTFESIKANCPDDMELDPEMDFIAEFIRRETGVTGAMDATDGADESPDVLLQRVRDLGEKVASLRGHIATMTTQRGRTRQKLSEAIHSYSRGPSCCVTPLDNVRAYLVSSNAERQAKAEAGYHDPQMPTPGKSVVDRQAMYSGHAAGDPNSFVFKQHRTGFRRGGAPASVKGAPTRLPSERA